MSETTTAQTTTTPNQEPPSPKPVDPAATGVYAAQPPPAEPVQEAKPQQEPVQQTAEPQSTEPPEPPKEGEPKPVSVPKPSEYVLPEGAPDNLRIFAHEHGLSQEQLDASLQQFGGYIQGMDASQRQALRQAGEAHVKNWGSEAKTRLSLAKQALRQNDPDGKLSQALEASGYGNHPAVLDFLYGLGKSMQEGGFLKASVRRAPGEKTAAQALFGQNHPSKEG